MPTGSKTVQLQFSCSVARLSGWLCTGKPRAGGITLKLLIDEGILEPGENVLTVEYKSSMTSASLAGDGRIHCAVRRFFGWDIMTLVHCIDSNTFYSIVCK